MLQLLNIYVDYVDIYPRNNICSHFATIIGCVSHVVISNIFNGTFFDWKFSNDAAGAVYKWTSILLIRIQ